MTIDSHSRVDAPKAATLLATLDCVHCGLCLEHCPTYRITGRESSSPRGRLYLMRALLEGRTEATPGLVSELDECLGCRACESACPSGVRYGEIASEVRAPLRRRGRWRRLLMDRVLPYPGRLQHLATLLRFLRRSPLFGARRFLSARVRRLSEALPEIPPRANRGPLAEHSPARGDPRGTVTFLEGCVMPVLFGDVNRDTVTLLNHAGYDVRVPKTQTCCGALHEHDGDLERARILAERNLAAFDEIPALAVITNSAGCGAALAGYSHRVGRALSAPVVDITRFLLDHGSALEFAPLRRRVAHRAPCHLQHGLREKDAPSALLQRIPELELVPMRDAELCCGAAGIYNLDHPEMSDAVLDLALDALFESGAEILVSGNPGCLLQWQRGVQRRGYPIRVAHPVTLLAEQARATARG